MRNLIRLFTGVAAAALLTLAPGIARGQGVTSAAIEGVVTDASGQPVVGANVTGVHTPSGSTYSTVTRSGGNYTLPNVKVGGPYTVTVSSSGSATKRVSGINTDLSQATRVNVALSAGAPPSTVATEAATAGDPGRVIVEASVIDDEIFSPTRSGTATNVGRQTIESLPSISRSLQDFTRVTPQVNGGSVGGANNRFNNISIDGATINDAFGLEASGLLTARSEPISLDVIDQVRVSLTPYDVRQSNFTGGSIDAVTKAGTNKFHGSLYGYYRDADFVGRTTYTVRTPANERGKLRSRLDGFEDYTYGLTLGGPIIKDKLFFFFGYESKRRTEPQLGSLGVIGGSSGFFSTALAVSNTDLVIGTTNTRYGYNPGTIGTALDSVEDDKYFVRIDWNITKDQKLTLRYNHVDSFFTDGMSRSSTLFTLTGRQYTRPYTSDSFVAQLFSTWTSSFTTEARVAYNRLRTERQVATVFPAVDVLVDSNRTITFGVERSSQQNQLDQDVIESVFNASLFVGNHTLTMGVNVDNYAFRNFFVQDAFGTYLFTTPQNYIDGRPSRYRFSYLLPGGNDTVNWSYYNLGLYLQDEWKVTRNLTVTAGIRADLPIFPDSPRDNTVFAAAFPGLNTSKLPSGQWAFSPRFGFNWNVFGTDFTGSESAPQEAKDGKSGPVYPNRKKWYELGTVVRGGVGLFNGKTPAVWLSNQYSNTGLDFARIDRSFGGSTFGSTSSASAGFFQTTPDLQPRAGQAGLSPVATTAIALTSPDFRFPQTLRSNLAIDQRLPFGLVLTLEGLYSQSVEAVTYRNVNLGAATTTLPDGRRRYSTPTANASYTSVIEIGNTNKGHSYIGTVSLERPMTSNSNWSFKFAYTRSNVRAAGDYTSSVALSNWQNNVITDDANAPRETRSFFEIRDRIVATLSFAINKGKPWQTMMSLIYDGHSGQPYSYVFSNDVNNDGVSGNDSFYVPRDRNDAVITAAGGATVAAATDAFFAYIENNKFLRNNKGRILPVNGGTNPWVNRLDFRLAQSVPIPARYGKLEVYFDVLNVLNLISPRWGGVKTMGGSLFNNVFLTSATVTGGRYNYTVNPANLPQLATPTGTSGSFSSASAGQANLDARWQMQIGARYSF